MTMCKDERFLCPLCGAEQQFRMYPSVNVTVNPELKEKILDHTLPVMTCRSCGEKTMVFYHLLYHDVSRRLAVWLVYPPGEGLSENEQAFGIHYTSRQVKDWWELCEKINISDYGCEDYEIELAKLIIAIDVGIKESDRFIFSNFAKTDTCDKLAVFLWFNEEGPCPMYLDWSVFVEEKGYLFPCLEEMFKGQNRWVYLNRKRLHYYMFGTETIKPLRWRFI